MKPIPVLQNSAKFIKYLITLLALLIIGFTIGWLVGMSTSPIVAVLVTALLSIVTAIVGIRSKDTAEIKIISPFQISIICIGLLIGAHVGVIYRTHDLLGYSTQLQIQKWNAEELIEESEAWGKLGLDKVRLAEYFLEIKYDKDFQNRLSRGYTPNLIFDNDFIRDEFNKWTELGFDNQKVLEKLFQMSYIDQIPQLSIDNEITVSPTGGTRLVETPKNNIQSVTGLFSNPITSNICDSNAIFQTLTDENGNSQEIITFLNMSSNASHQELSSILAEQPSEFTLKLFKILCKAKEL